MHRNPSVSSHKFAMIPKADIPRSAFRMQKTLKTTFDAGYLIPIYCEEMLPGDRANVKATVFARMATLLFPVMDNMYIETFFFFVPNRLTWSNWQKFMGEQDNPSDSISYVIPQIVSPAGGFAVSGIYDMFGLPTVGQVAGGSTISINALPLRAYNQIYKQWFRDENLINSPTINLGNGPDTYTDYALRRRGKRHDYFTSCLPWPQKGNTAVTLPLTGNAWIKGLGIDPAATPSTGTQNVDESDGTNLNYSEWYSANSVNTLKIRSISSIPNIYADLSTATSATINAIRLAFQTQKFLERDARGGTRYTELVFTHFGVRSPDMRLQRPEYLGGGKSAIQINPIAQTGQTGLTGGSTPLGTLGAMATAVAHGHGFNYAATEHGYIIGLACVDADLTYQQGIRRHWSRSTRYDFYDPAFAMLGEQAVLNKEIYARGDANDALTFGYQERWAEYRYNPSEICGLFKSTASGTIDPWHLSQKFTSLPTLNQTFIESTPPVDRIVAVTSTGKQFLCDIFFDGKWARPMPLYSVPGLIDHF
ncbi:MAG: major capsid protein [Microviridae sp.]|nr:MAG: major capsid protein [Microviridae sp.]